jgi:hypothetical protein
MPAEDQPKKRKSSAKKKEITLPNLSGVNIQDVIKEAFARFGETESSKLYKLQDLEHLDNIATEYLKAFIILGYDFNGEKVHIFHANNPHDRDALVEHLRTTLINIVSNNND